MFGILWEREGCIVVGTVTPVLAGPFALGWASLRGLYDDQPLSPLRFNEAFSCSDFV